MARIGSDNNHNCGNSGYNNTSNATVATFDGQKHLKLTALRFDFYQINEINSIGF